MFAISKTLPEKGKGITDKFHRVNSSKSVVTVTPVKVESKAESGKRFSTFDYKISTLKVRLDSEKCMDFLKNDKMLDGVSDDIDQYVENLPNGYSLWVDKEDIGLVSI